MRKFTLDLEGHVEPDLTAELEKQSIYVSQNLRSFRVVGSSRIEIEFEGDEFDKVLIKTKRFVEGMRKSYRPIDQKTIASNERSRRRPYETEVFQNLVDRGWVIDLGHGQVALSGPALTVFNKLDRDIAEVGTARFAAVERAYPTLIPSEALLRCGYPGSFPQHLSFVSHLNEDFDSIEAFRTAHVAAQELTMPPSSDLSQVKVCLCPALCYHAYPTLEKRSLGRAGHVETSVGRIARYESTSMTGLDRLWEFTQRSIIWLGEDIFCDDRRQRAIKEAIGLAQKWDIDCTIETASDPFFASVATAKSFWQRSQDLKFEMRAPIEPAADGSARTIAAASFNLHGTFFGAAFEILDETGGPAFSGCASWGLERMVLVLFTQHGYDPGDWPESFRSCFPPRPGI